MRTIAIRRSILAVTITLLATALALTAAALAAKPKPGAHFTGRTATPPVLGFYAPVKFTVSGDGRTLQGLSFGSLGCLGAGGFRPGVSPYVGSSVLHVGVIRKVASGRFSASGAKSTYRQPKYNETTVTTISVKVRFSRPKVATGSITFSQSITGSYKASCGPATIAFTATSR